MVSEEPIAYINIKKLFFLNLHTFTYFNGWRAAGPQVGGDSAANRRRMAEPLMGGETVVGELIAHRFKLALPNLPVGVELLI